MTVKLVSKTHSMELAKAFVNDFSSSSNNTYYVFLAEHVPFEDDAHPPTPNNTVGNLQFDIFNKMICGKLITSSDVVLLANRHSWIANTVYQRYDDQEDNLEDTSFCVLADEAGAYHVFKCLNNDGSASTSKPLLSETSADDDSYIKLVDGYQWKYMYSIDSTQYTKFVTDNYMPVYPNSNVATAAVNGSIDVVAVEFSGSGYNSYTTGMFQDFNIGGNTQIFTLNSSAAANSGFYNGCSLYVSAGTGAGQLRVINSYVVAGSQKKVILDSAFEVAPDVTSEYNITPYVIITGDGDGAKARAVVDDEANTISGIEVIDRGSDYSWASVEIVGNTGIVNVTSNVAIQANSAVGRAIISPKNGHGSNAYFELYASDAEISVTFSNTESGKLTTTNDYRTFGIIKNPLFANVSLTIAAANGSFGDEDVVLQANTNATGIVTFANSTVVRITRAAGIFQTGKRISNVANASISANVTAISGQNTVFNCSTTMVINLTSVGTFGNGFSLDETVIQDLATADVLFANSTMVKLTNIHGTFDATSITGQTSGAVATVVSITGPEIVRYAGDVLYIDNSPPVQRANTQAETIKLVVSF